MVKTESNDIHFSISDNGNLKQIYLDDETIMVDITLSLQDAPKLVWFFNCLKNRGFIKNSRESSRVDLKKQIINHIAKKVDDARKINQINIEFKAGEVHKELNLNNRMPSVCKALESPELRNQCKIEDIDRGRVNPSTTFWIKFKILY